MRAPLQTPVCATKPAARTVTRRSIRTHDHAATGCNRLDRGRSRRPAIGRTRRTVKRSWKSSRRRLQRRRLPLSRAEIRLTTGLYVKSCAAGSWRRALSCAAPAGRRDGRTRSLLRALRPPGPTPIPATTRSPAVSPRATRTAPEPGGGFDSATRYLPALPRLLSARLSPQ